jgi:hypothetical protein
MANIPLNSIIISFKKSEAKVSKKSFVFGNKEERE